MRLRILIWAMAGLTALASGATNALAFNPQPDPPGRAGIQEKVHLPIYDPLGVELVATVR
jgi:hypothetical protein